MKIKISLGALFLLCCLALPVQADSQDDSDAQYQNAEHSYLANDTTSALKTLDGYLALPAQSQRQHTLVKVHNLRGLIFFQQKNLNAAIQEFDQAVQIANHNVDPHDSVVHLARYNYANALYQNAHPQEAAELLQTVEPNALDLDTRVRFFHLYGNICAASEQELCATENFLQAASLAKDEATSDAYVQKAFTASQKIFLSHASDDIAAMEKLQNDLTKNSSGALALEVILARGYMYVGNNAHAEANLKDFLAAATPNHPLRARATELLAEMDKLGDVAPNTIGLLLPLSGKFARFGRLCMNAAFMAANVYEDMPDSHSPQALKFAIRDSGDTPESAQEALKKLILEDHVIAVVGPLLSKQFPLVAQTAQELGTPLLGLSQRVDSEKTGSFVFPIALTPNQQIDMIIQHAMEQKGYKRFAILAPSDNFGDEYVNLFWDAVEAHGGKITAVERYEPKSTDFREEIRDLLGLGDTDARKLELEEINRRKEIYASTLKVKGALRQRLLKNYSLPAIVDFDAIFLPDDPQTVGQIAPSFAVEGIENIPMLGINTWNTNGIIQRAGRYLQKSLFVDAYFSASKNRNVQAFQQHFQNYFQTQPSTIEVQAYDAVSILQQTLNLGALNNRAKLRDQLIAQGHFQGISGEFIFSDSGVKRSAHLLTVRGNSISEISTQESKQQ